MLTNKQLGDIQSLQQKCEEADQINLKLNWDMLNSRSENEKNDFLVYQNDQLVGFIGIYGFGNKVELCGMVHPDYRRQGIFKRLLEESIIECRKREVRQILINAPAASISAKGFLSQFPSTFSFAEYQMKWSGSDANWISTEGVEIRPATIEDRDLEIKSDVLCFGFLEEEAQSFYDMIYAEGTQPSFIILASDIPVGKFRLQRLENESWIFGLAILPEYQGKGYGRKTLISIIQKEAEQNHGVFLEVAAGNENALHLYTSSGFEAYNTQDYYELNFYYIRKCT